MKLAPKVLLALFVATLLLLVTPSCAGAGRAVGPGPPDARVLPHLGQAEMAWSLSWFRADRRWTHADNRLRAAFGLRALDRVQGPPRILAYPSVWRTHTATWREQAKARLADSQRLSRRANDPPRPLTRESWRPLISLYWPAGLVNRALHIMGDEAHYAPYAKNPSSGAFGFFQLLPGPSNHAPWYQAWYAYVHKYLPSLHACGDGFRPWAASGEGL